VQNKTPTLKLIVRGGWADLRACMPIKRVLIALLLAATALAILLGRPQLAEFLLGMAAR